MTRRGCTGLIRGASGAKPVVAQVAQSVEQWIENPRVGGSIPPLGTITSIRTSAYRNPTKLKVDALSLDKALTVWKMKFVLKMSHAEIAYELEQNPRFAKRQIKTGRDYERSEYTDPRNTVIVRLWKKAQKNIEAVERGEFGLGH